MLQSYNKRAFLSSNQIVDFQDPESKINLNSLLIYFLLDVCLSDTWYTYTG